MTSWLSPPSSRWAQPEEWLPRARRQGPLRYSELGSLRLAPPDESVAAWLAGEADAWWDEEGRPDPFVLVVVSGDDGRLAGGLLDKAPKCTPALRYVAVNPFGPPIKGVPLEEPAFLFPAAGLPEIDEEQAPPAAGVGPLLTALGDLPSLPGAAGAVIAIEFLSRLPADRFEWRDGEWYELRVAARDDDLCEIAVAAPAPLGVPAEPGRHLQPTGAADWLGRMLNCLGTGRVVAVDKWGDWLSQLSRVRRPDGGPTSAVPGLESVTWRIA